jgi:predicted DNA-binding protein
MAVISIRLNEEEEKKVQYLSSLYNEDKSTLIKHSINEMYEEIRDKQIIDNFENSENKKKPVFVSSEEILRDII